eukprot:976997-Pleurochrysis_carterae.AAC.1
MQRSPAGLPRARSSNGAGSTSVDSASVSDRMDDSRQMERGHVRWSTRQQSEDGCCVSQRFGAQRWRYA